MSVMLYPRVYPITDLPETLQSDEPYWAFQDPTSEMIVKPACYPSNFVKGFS